MMGIYLPAASAHAATPRSAAALGQPAPKRGVALYILVRACVKCLVPEFESLGTERVAQDSELLLLVSPSKQLSYNMCTILAHATVLGPCRELQYPVQSAVSMPG